MLLMLPSWFFSVVLMSVWRCACRAAGYGGELRVKQEAHADFAAMSREHVTEEDIETFTHVQELAVQVRKLGKGSTSSTSTGIYGLTEQFATYFY